MGGGEDLYSDVYGMMARGDGSASHPSTLYSIQVSKPLWSVHSSPHHRHTASTTLPHQAYQHTPTYITTAPPQPHSPQSRTSHSNQRTHINTSTTHVTTSPPHYYHHTITATAHPLQSPHQESNQIIHTHFPAMAANPPPHANHNVTTPPRLHAPRPSPPTTPAGSQVPQQQRHAPSAVRYHHQLASGITLS
ncbi:uncharacterized protein LOC135090812 [Scylla paramamosain]|uniref:uncharacterized protein LOC135090812 n=1 Tax=Scylla paramamosain TaxID=85552 RepID=UPI0030838F12